MMKKHTRYATLAALFAVPLLTTQPLSAQFVLAARAGMSFATLAYRTDPEGVDIGYRRGMSVGLSATYYLAEHVGVRLGGAFVQKGATADLDDEDVTANMKINYVELSPLLDLRIPLGDGGTSLHVLAGPAVAFKRLCEVESGPSDGRSKARCETIDLKVKSMDLGVTAGAGFTLPLVQEPAVALSLEAMYTHGLRQFENFVLENPAKNRAFVAQAGLSFPVG